MGEGWVMIFFFAHKKKKTFTSRRFAASPSSPAKAGEGF